MLFIYYGAYMTIDLEKFYEKNNPSITNQEFLEKLENENGDFLDDLYKKYLYRTQEHFLSPLQAELIKLQEHLEKHNEKMIILVEGRDASGKGGAIRRITRYMNEKHYRVVALGKPSDVQRTQWYFQRYVEQFPCGGEMVLFDRSWYNRAMVEPIFGFCTQEQYKVFMQSVPKFEADLIAHGFHFIKLYFSVSKDEQARRFLEREENPLKQWKLSEIDLQMQQKWDEFTIKKFNMLKKTNTKKSPWTIIRSDSKFLARVNAIKTILNKVDYEGRSSEIDFSVDSNIVISAEKELELMEMSSK
jgi:polyphosphate kinase